MKRRTICWIAALVLLAHLAVFALLSNGNVLPKTRHVPRPNFSSGIGEFVDAETGEKRIYREFTVSTTLRGDVAHPPIPPVPAIPAIPAK